MNGSMKWALPLTAGMALGPIAAAPAALIELDAVADTHLRAEWADDNNFGGLEPLRTNAESTANSSGNYRPLFKFDISGVESQVTSATLVLRQDTSGNASTFRALRGIGAGSQDWVELQASWNSYATGLSWTTPGGDYTTQHEASGTSTGTLAIINFDVTDMVQAAKDDGQSYLTVFIFGDGNHASGDWDSLQTRESTGDNTTQPKLTVDSVVPEPASLALIGLGGLMMWCRPRRGV